MQRDPLKLERHAGDGAQPSRTIALEKTALGELSWNTCAARARKGSRFSIGTSFSFISYHFGVRRHARKQPSSDYEPQCEKRYGNVRKIMKKGTHLESLFTLCDVFSVVNFQTVFGRPSGGTLGVPLGAPRLVYLQPVKRIAPAPFSHKPRFGLDLSSKRPPE